MPGEAESSGRETLLTETVNELRVQLTELRAKKAEAQQKLDDIKGRLELTQEEEHRTEERMKDILKVEARLEELMDEEERLLREKSDAESELFEIKRKLDKVKDIDRKIEGEDDA